MWPQAVDVLWFVGLAGLTFAPLEHFLGARHAHRTGRATDLAFATMGQLLTQLALALLTGCMLALADAFGPEHRALGWMDAGVGRDTCEVALGLLAFELAGYAYHRLAHRIPALWKLHEVHHSARSLDWLASFRQHPLEIVLMTALQNLPLVLLGLPLGSHATVLLLLKLNTVFVHADIVLPRGMWEHVLAGPRFHHRHHQALGPARNFASLLPVLDRLFGSYCGDDAEQTGLAVPVSRGFVGLLMHPFRAQSSATVQTIVE